ncbi:MAG: hypothetical protein ABFD69_08085, partial [Candidatus Sumerlaeia bacterium]
ALKAREKPISLALSELRLGAVRDLGLRFAPPQAFLSCAFSAKRKLIVRSGRVVLVRITKDF